MAEYLAVAAVSAAATYVLCRAVLRLFPRWGLMDRPHLYGHARAPVPYSAGLVFLPVFALLVLLFLSAESKAIALLLAAAVVGALSFADDRFGLSPFTRLTLQAVVALCLFFAGFQVATLTHPFTGGTLELAFIPVEANVAGVFLSFSLLSLIMTVGWIVLFMNTLNWLDGVPGMVSGISTVALGVVFILSLLLSLRTGVGAQEIADARLVAVLALGLCLMAGTFFAFDVAPPRLLMGDAGTMVLGLLVAALSVYAGSKVATVFLVLGFPIMDALFVIARRLWSGKSPFRGDFGHFHHRLLRIGFSQRQAVWAVAGICAVFGGAALLLGSVGKVAMVSLLILFSAGVEWAVWRRERSLARATHRLEKK